jgi:hypothetical protein
MEPALSEFFARDVQQLPAALVWRKAGRRRPPVCCQPRVLDVMGIS